MPQWVAPVAVTEVVHQQRHTSLLARHESLEEHDLMGVIDMVLDEKSTMLEVGLTTITTGLTDASVQRTCGFCRKLAKECKMTPLPAVTHSTMKVKCDSCRRGKRRCPWGEVIPLRLHSLKFAIITEHTSSDMAGKTDSALSETVRIAPQVVDKTDSALLSEKFLLRFKVITETALHEVQLKIEEANEHEIDALASGIQHLHAQSSLPPSAIPLEINDITEFAAHWDEMTENPGPLDQFTEPLNAVLQRPGLDEECKKEVARLLVRVLDLWLHISAVT